MGAALHVVISGAENTSATTQTSAQTMVPTTEMPTSQSAPTTTVVDPAGVETSETADVYENPILNPYPSAQFDKSLERMYVVNRGVWSNEGVGDVLTRIRFPDIFSTFSQLTGKLSTFQYMRADVRVRIKINGNLNLAGRLMYGAMPVCPGDIDVKNIRTVSGCTVRGDISANSAKTIEFVLPYATPFPGISTTLSTPPLRGILWQLILVVLNPLVSDIAVPSAFYTIEAGFTNVKVWGIAQEAEIVKNLTSMIPLPSGRTEASPVNGSLSADSTVSKIVEPIVAALLGSKPSSARPVFNNVVDPLADANVTSDSSLPVVNAVDPFTDMTRQRTAAPLDLGGIFTQRRTLHPYDSFREIAKMPMLFDFFDYTIEDEPGDLLWQSILNPAWAPGFTPDGGASFYIQPDYLSWVAQFFKWFHGSMEYMFQVTTNQLTSGALRIVYFPSGYDVPNVYVDQGDAMSMVLEIRGDSSIKVSCPYLNNLPLLSTKTFPGNDPLDRFNYGNIAVYVERPLTTNIAGIPVVVNVYRAGGPDVVFAGPHQHTITDVAGDLVAPSKSFEYLRESLDVQWCMETNSFAPYKSTTPGNDIAPEYFDSIKQALCSPRTLGLADETPGTSLVFPPAWMPVYPLTAKGFACAHDTWRLFCLIFQFARGGQFIQKVVQNNNPGCFDYMAADVAAATFTEQPARHGLTVYSQRGARFRYFSSLPYADKALVAQHYADRTQFPVCNVDNSFFKRPAASDTNQIFYDPIPCVGLLNGYTDDEKIWIRSCDDDTMQFGLQPPPMIQA